MAYEQDQGQGFSLHDASSSDGGTATNLYLALEMLRGTLEGAPDLIAVEDTASHYIAFNSAYHAEFKKVFGVDLKIGSCMIDVLAHLPEEQMAVTEIFNRTIRGEEFVVTHEFGDKRLARKYYELHCFPVRDSDGRVIGGSHIARDLTEQRRAQEALRASEENYRRIIESSMDCIKMLDLDGHLLSINPVGQRLLELETLCGYLGHVWLDGWQGEDRRQASMALDRARAGEVGRFRAQGITAKGSPKWWEVTVSPILDADGRPERVLVIERDITEQKKAEDELRRSEEFNRRIIASSDDCIKVLDLDLNMLSMSEGGKRLMEIEDIEPYLNTSYLKLWKNEDEANVNKAVAAALAGEVGRYEGYCPSVKGTPRWWDGRVTPIRGADGRPERLLVIARDITEQKLAQEALQRERTFLRQVIDATPSVVFVKDREGRFVLANQALADCYGTTIENVIGKTDADFNPRPDELKQFIHDDQEVMSTCREKMIPEERVTFSNGEVHWFSTFKVPLIDEDGTCDKVLGVASDITERKRAEEALRQSEDRLKLAQHAGHVGVFDWDIAADRAVITGELETIVGLSLDEEDGTYENWTRYVHPDDLALLKEVFEQCIRERRYQINHEYRIIRPDTQVRWIEVNGQFGYRDDGLPARMVGTIVDITDRKNVEIALRESEQKFRILAENARASFGIVQGQRFVYANPWFAQISGYSVEELLTMDFPQLVHPEYQARMMEWARRRQMGEPVPNHYEFAMLTKTGEKRWVEFSVGAVEYQGKPAIIGTGFDITARKQAEEALQQRNERMTLLSEAAAHLLKAENPETMILELFEKVSRNLDVQAYMNFMVNEAGDALQLDSCAGVPQDTVNSLQRLAFGQELCGTVAQVRHAIHAPNLQYSDDKKVQLLKNLGIRAYFCNPLMAGDRLLGTLAFATNSRDAYSEDDLEFMRTISWYVAMARERLRLEGELRRHIEQLGSTNAALAEADRRKNEFLAMLAHELRNPLAPIRNAMQVLRTIDLQEPAQKRQGDIIDRQISHMARLLNDLLDVSRITRGKVELRRQPLALDDVVTHAVETARPLIEDRHHILNVSASPPNLRVLADLDRMAQVVGNLLTNSAKYTEEGGRIWLDAAREGDEAVIRVRDNGVGIALELLPHIFDLFTQAEQTLARSQGGLGIGLTMVRSLVEMHGGSVEAHSAGLGQGSEFVIRLPALPDKSPSLDTRHEPPHAAVTENLSRRVLVVDDIADTAQSLSYLLELWGHQVRVAYDGSGALAEARAFKPEIVLLDIGLPDMDGFAVARNLRQEPGGDKVIIVAMTGYGQQSDQQQSSEAGFNQHLIKPVDLDNLRKLLELSSA